MKHRLAEHDYAGLGFYFVTAVTKPRRALFSRLGADGGLVLTPEGELAADAWSRLTEDAPDLHRKECVFMPDHFHAAVIACRPLPKPLGAYIGNFKGRVRQAIRRLHGNPGEQIWEPGYFDIVALNAQMFAAFRNYIEDNPRRAALRRANRALFRKARDAAHPRLPASRSWTAVGDLALLDYPLLMPVVISRRLQGPALDNAVAGFVRRAAFGEIAIGGFISPGEKRVAREIAALPRARVIYLLPCGMAGYKPQGQAVDRIAESRTLVLSGFGDETPASPLSYENCHFNNELAVQIAAGPAPPPVRR